MHELTENTRKDVLLNSEKSVERILFLKSRNIEKRYLRLVRYVHSNKLRIKNRTYTLIH